MKTREIEYKKNENGCHICTSHVENARGFPRMMKHGKVMKVRDYVYATQVEPFGDDEEIIHGCGDKHCINLDHLKKIPKTPNGLGSKNSRAILNEEQVVEIKKRLKQSIGVRDLAKQLNIHPSTIYNIKRGHTWGHIK